MKSDYILKFTAPWCGACKDLDNTLYGHDLGLRVNEIDIDKDEDLLDFYGVRRIPTMIRLKEGKVAGGYLITPETLEEVQEWIRETNHV